MIPIVSYSTTFNERVSMIRIPCDECKSMFFFDEEAKETMTGMTLKNKNYCPECVFKMHECNVCGSTFVSKNVMRRQIELCKECRKERIGFTSPWIHLRFKTFQRDKFTCVYCGRSPIDDKSIRLQCDHVIPLRFAGEDKLDNLVTACFECNQGKLCIMLEKETKDKLKKRRDFTNESEGIFEFFKTKGIVKVEDSKDA